MTPLRAVLLVLAVLTPAGVQAIVGGVTATEGDVPGQVALVDLSRPDDATCTASGGSEIFCKQFCAGVLIAPRWIVTAAHCVDDSLTSVGLLRVVAGTADLYSATTANTYTIAKKIIHPVYGLTDARFASDIALLKLDSPLAFPLASLAETAFLAALKADAPSKNDEVAASGWGRLSNTGKFPKKLQRVGIDLQLDSICQSTYNVTGGVQNFIAGSMLCAAEFDPSLIEDDDVGDLSPRDEDGEGVCNYDSGGPLTFFANGFLQVAGLTSFAPKGACASTRTPSVFTSVVSFVDWIESAISLDGDKSADLALTIAGPSVTAPGSTADLVVSLRNASIATSLTGAGFTLPVPTNASLSVVSAPGFSCAIASGLLTCTVSGSLSAGSLLQATLRVTPVSSASLDVRVAAEAHATDLVDYRSGNNTSTHRVLFSSAPDLALELTGFVQEVDATTGSGTAWVVGKLANRSGSVSATGVGLALTLPAGLQLDAWEGLDCTVTGSTCSVGDLGAGEERAFRARLIASRAVDVNGNVEIQASASNGDFPAQPGGVSDTVDSVTVKFNVVRGEPEGVDSGSSNTPLPSPPVGEPATGDDGSGGDGSSSGGSVGWGGLLMLGLGLMLRRRLH